ncbi:related to Peptidyl-prolyl cis-trans isomerase CYP7 [Saccharomycodes ludwigii]|uniref:peptidylprolyl isomerase n=1 Tax=Saccharomycodes ludwigii TaxID=36035 RepID=A0A376B130_9ASCO|nr:related to Peptidyl-prolyl cis-trans isomerase CYP7 [Saccharomycodes ludwigii]
MDASKYIYLDIKIENHRLGRIVIELFKDKAPKATYNFYHLCKGDKQIDGKQLTLKNNIFHRVFKNFMIQAGDIVYGSIPTDGNVTTELNKETLGKGGCSIYSKKWPLSCENTGIDNETSSAVSGNFEDENTGEFTSSMLVAMANAGTKDTNSSQFFITTYPSPHLNGKHSVFGKVIHGKCVVRNIESVDVDKSDGVPLKNVIIEDCGEWNESMDIPFYNGCNDTIGGDIYEEYPIDETRIKEDDFNEAYRISDIIKNSGSLLFKKRDYENSIFKYLKAVRYVNEYIPDLDMDKENHIKFFNLKVKIYLNICFCFFNLKDFNNAIKYSAYILELDETVNDMDLAKAYSRRGNSYYAQKKYELALKDYKNCKIKNPDDKVVDQKIETAEKLLIKEKEKSKRNLAKFFD